MHSQSNPIRVRPGASRRDVLAALTASAAAGFALPLAARGVAAGPVEALCRAPVQVADAVQGSSENLTGERADFDMLEKLGLLEGHLIIAMALLRANMPREAEPHFGHPVTELYRYLEPQIERRGAVAFKDDLSAIQAQARQGSAAPLPQLYAVAIDRADALRRTVSPELRARPSFVLGVVAQLVVDAAEDYGAAVERGRIANTAEYHDAIGFLMYCERFTAHQIEGATGRSVRAYQTTLNEIRAALRAFPSLRPPARAPFPVGALRARAARIADLGKDA
jgi:hypothetical protein